MYLQGTVWLSVSQICAKCRANGKNAQVLHSVDLKSIRKHYIIIHNTDYRLHVLLKKVNSE